MGHDWYVWFVSHQQTCPPMKKKHIRRTFVIILSLGILIATWYALTNGGELEVVASPVKGQAQELLASVSIFKS